MLLSALWVTALVMGPASLGLPSVPAAPVAAAVDVEGDVGPALALGAGLASGTTVTLGAAAHVTLWVYPDTLWTVEGPGRFVLDPGRVLPMESSHVPASATIPVLARAPVIEQAVVLPAGDGAGEERADGVRTGPLRPAGEAVPADQRVLRWSAPPGEDASLTLAVRRPDGPPRLLERWTGLRGGRLRTWAPLLAGRWYRWEVRVAGETARAWFYVWTQAEQAALREALAVALPPLGPHPDTAAAAVRALTLERAGAWGEALARWRELLAVRPDAPGVAARIRAIEARVVGPPPRGLPALIARALGR